MWVLLVLRRLGFLLVSLFAASVLVFLTCAVLPGDPARVALGVEATQESVSALRHQLGVDRPLVVQYADWVGGLPRGDFGRSYVTQVDIGEQIADRLGVTLSLVAGGMVVAILIAVPLGVLAAVRHRRASGVALTVASQLGLAVPSFWAGILLSYVFAVRLQWLPASGYTNLADDPGEWLRHLLLPWLALGLVQGAVLMRYVRSAVLDILREDFMRTARAVGRTASGALWRHGLRNAAIPVVTVLGLQLATLLVGAIIIESVFTLPGIGTMLLQGVANRDLLLVQGTIMVLVTLVLALNWFVEGLYPVLDPRLRRAL
jgi:peptide/nickel transport system permease protein